MWFKKKAEPVTEISVYDLYLEGDEIVKKYYHHLKNFYEYSRQQNAIIDSGTRVSKLLGVR
jgi:hypothetical protein